MKTIFIILLLAASVCAQQVGLRFNGEFNQHVNHGLLWEHYYPGNPNILAADFAWEAWVKISPDMQNGYIISAGYGGAHAILLGFDKYLDKYRMIGNFHVLPNGVCDAAQGNISFGSNYVFMPDVWHHVAVASKDNLITGYKDGQPVFTKPWQGARISSVCNYYDASAGILYVGGSTHINFTGSISQVRGWEGFTPYTGGSFTPQTTFTRSWTNPDQSIVESNFLAFYKPRKHLIKDVSNGYRGSQHHGIMRVARPQFWRQ